MGQHQKFLHQNSTPVCLLTLEDFLENFTHQSPSLKLETIGLGTDALDQLRLEAVMCLILQDLFTSIMFLVNMDSVLYCQKIVRLYKPSRYATFILTITMPAHCVSPSFL